MHETPDEGTLREWFRRYGPPPLDDAGRFDYQRWHAHELPPWRHHARPWWAGLAAALAVVGVLVVVHRHPPQARTHPALRWPVPASALPAPSNHLAVLARSGPVAFVNAAGLFVASSTYGLVHVSTNPSAANPLWSAGGTFLSYTTTTDAGTVVDIALASTGTLLYSTIANGFAWRPGHHQGVLIRPGGLQLLQVSSTGVRPIGRELRGHIDWGVLWSSDGSTLTYAVRRVSGPDNDRVYNAPVGVGGFGVSGFLFASAPNTGVSLAAMLPHSGAVLYWLDPAQSASIMADGTPLMEWRGPGQQSVRYRAMLTSPTYLTASPAGSWAYMAGTNRVLSGGKSVVQVIRGRSIPLVTPREVEVIEPALNPVTGSIAAVLAANQPNASTSLSAAYRQWVATRRLAIWQHGRWQIWANAGAGVTDPTWAAEGAGLFYLDANWLWFAASPHARPIAVVGPIAATGGYYGQVPPPVFASRP